MKLRDTVRRALRGWVKRRPASASAFLRPLSRFVAAASSPDVRSLRDRSAFLILRLRLHAAAARGDIAEAADIAVVGAAGFARSEDFAYAWASAWRESGALDAFFHETRRSSRDRRRLCRGVASAVAGFDIWRSFADEPDLVFRMMDAGAPLRSVWPREAFEILFPSRSSLVLPAAQVWAESRMGGPRIGLEAAARAQTLLANLRETEIPAERLEQGEVANRLADSWLASDLGEVLSAEAAIEAPASYPEELEQADALVNALNEAPVALVPERISPHGSHIDLLDDLVAGAAETGDDMAALDGLVHLMTADGREGLAPPRAADHLLVVVQGDGDLESLEAQLSRCRAATFVSAGPMAAAAAALADRAATRGVAVTVIRHGSDPSVRSSELEARVIASLDSYSAHVVTGLRRLTAAQSALDRYPESFAMSLTDRLFATAVELEVWTSILEKQCFDAVFLTDLGRFEAAEFASLTLASSSVKWVAAPAGALPASIRTSQAPASTSALDAVIRFLNDRAEAGAAAVPTSAANSTVLVVAGQTRNASYAAALDRLARAKGGVERRLIADFAVAGDHSVQTRFARGDITVPIGKMFLKAAAAARRVPPNLFQEAAAELSKGWEPAGAEASKRAMQARLQRGLARALAADVPYLWAVSGWVEQLLDRTHVRGVVVCPGRLAPIDLLCRAANRRGVRSVDVQVLLVMNSARYRPPAAGVCAIMDTFSEEIYRDFFKVPDRRLLKIGSILNEPERTAVVRARRRQSPRERRLLVATQPTNLPAFLSAVAVAARLVRDRPGWRLIIKLHPAEAVENQAAYAHHAVDAAGLFDVLQDVPFSAALAGADILVTGYSNVAITAATVETSVVTFSYGFEGQFADYSRHGVCEIASSAEALAELLDDAMRRAEAGVRDPAKPPWRYIRANPMMVSPGAADRALQLALRRG